MAGEKTVKRCLFAVVELGVVVGGGPSYFIVKNSPNLWIKDFWFGLWSWQFCSLVVWSHCFIKKWLVATVEGGIGDSKSLEDMKRATSLAKVLPHLELHQHQLSSLLYWQFRTFNATFMDFGWILDRRVIDEKLIIQLGVLTQAYYESWMLD